MAVLASRPCPAHQVTQAAREACRVAALLPGARIKCECEFLRASLPHGLASIERADRLELVTPPVPGKIVEACLGVPPAEALSQAAQ